MVAGVRFAFEIPADLPANWVFRLWLDRETQAARTASKSLLLVFSLAWLAPLCFFVTLALWGWAIALLHTVILIVSTLVLVEASMLRFRKLPFTCSYPPFRSASGLVAVAYLFGFIFLTTYLVEIEHWALYEPWRTLCFIPIWAASLAGTHYYRKQLLEMDKQLLFEEAPASSFW